MPTPVPANRAHKLPPKVWPLIDTCAHEVQRHFVAYLSTGLLRCLWNITGWVIFALGLLYIAVNDFSQTALFFNSLRAVVTWPVLLLGSILLGLGEHRVIHRHLDGAGVLGLQAMLSASKERPFDSVVLALLLIALHAAALACCFLPVIPMSIALHMAMPFFVVEELSPWQAIVRSAKHARETPGWSTRSWLLDMVAAVAAGSLPILGWLLQTPVSALIDLLEHRSVMGKSLPGDSP